MVGKALVRLCEEGDLTVVFFTTILLFNSKLLLQFGAAEIHSLQRVFTFKFPYTERIFKDCKHRASSSISIASASAKEGCQT